ncbi:MAG: aminodeoxychorismate/anthranilate synthase component II [Alphaproteobacteria bacterium]|nr:MAG: aminodeoxychorismate/anthranilate synthase component II [Alphaproteobacteria bacterium]
MYLLIDNYDSFTYNLYHYLAELDVEVTVKRNDRVTVDEVLALAPRGIVLSPGPCTPDEAGICLDLTRQAAGRIPILGVCLGHQTIAQAFGGRIVRAPVPMHGKVSQIYHRARGVFSGLPNGFRATRYHSLIVERDTLPACFAITAETEDGIIMGIEHKTLPLHGVQFHPESIESENGHRILKNFINISNSFTPEVADAAV